MILKLDETKIDRIRKVVNDSPIFYESTDFRPKWNLICSFMDRIEDSVKELNRLKILSNREMSYSTIMLMFVYTDIIKSCIDVLWKEFNFSSENIETSHIFNEKGFDGQGSDDKYFYFLRNLSFAHTLKVSRSNPYLISNEQKEWVCSPIIGDNGSEIVITVYSNLRNTQDVSPFIKKEKLFEYIKEKYGVVDKIEIRLIEIVRNHHSLWNDQTVDTSKDIIEMLIQLKEFFIIRYEKYAEKHINEVIQLLKYNPSIESNVHPVNCYQEYVYKLAVNYIECFNSNDPSIQTHSFYDVFSMSREIGIDNSNYILEKIQVYLTEEESGENVYDYAPDEPVMNYCSKAYLGFEMLKEFKRKFSDKYVTIKYDMPFFEIQILVLTALYLFHKDD